MTVSHLDSARDGASSTQTMAPVPAALAPFADPSHVRTDYPLFLYPLGSEAEGRAVLPLSELLPELVSLFAPSEGQESVLKDNLPRLELAVVRHLGGHAGIIDAGLVLAQAGHAMADDLGLAEGPAAALHAAIDRLVSFVPVDGTLLSYGPSATWYLVAHAARLGAVSRRRALLTEVRGLRNKLDDLLAVERANSPEASGPEALLAAVGGGGGLDMAVLSQLVGKSKGSVRMAPERLARLERVHAVLDAALVADAPAVLTLVHAGDVLRGWVDADDVKRVTAEHPIAAGIDAFEAAAESIAKVVGAVRVARLELDGAYVQDVHGGLLDGFDWKAFTPDELLLVPAVFAFERADRLVGEGTAQLLPLLSSGRPVQVVTEVVATRNPGAGDDALGGYRVELGLLGLGMRQAWVQQTSPARAVHLVGGVLRALELARPGLHVVNSGYFGDDAEPVVGGWLAANAAVDARAHPLFQYDPSAGLSWASAMQLAGNTQPDADWPMVGDEDGAPFSFADYALLDPAVASQYRPLGDDEHGMALTEWLAAGAEAREGLVPTVQAMVGESSVTMVAGPHLLFACEDRQRGWHMLRELAGVANHYAQKAAEEARAEAQAAAAAERDQLMAEHTAQVESAQSAAAAEAMESLARVLLDADLAALPVGGSAPRPAASATPAAVEAEEPAEEQAPAPVEEEDEDDDMAMDDPWIDSALCTTCNDCINLNQLLFVYNDSKQAMIGDVSKGTYAELVTAAEKCPSRCIHPGKPANPNEPGLDELVKRAAPFN